MFRKIIEEFEESDEYCPRCDNHYMIQAVTPEAEQLDKALGVIEETKHMWGR